jgi:hypothetical protein
VSAVTYDAGALIAIDRGDVAVVARHRQLQRRGVVPVVPAGVLAQVWREGARQVRLGLALRGCRVEALDAVVARRVGELAKASGKSDVVDLSVAVSVLARGGVVYTSDPDDLAACGIPNISIQKV